MIGVFKSFLGSRRNSCLRKNFQAHALACKSIFINVRSPLHSSIDVHTSCQQPAWGRSREFEITTRSVNRNGMTQTTTGDLEDDDEAVEENGQIVLYGSRKRKVAFMPSLGTSKFAPRLHINFTLTFMKDTTHTIYYSGHWLRVSSLF